MELTVVQRRLLGAGIGVLGLCLLVSLLTHGFGRGKVTVIDDASAQPVARAASAGPTAVSPMAFPVTVGVVGAVRSPGVYRLAAGARIYDAVNAAGGFSDGADAGAVNLAASIGDGQQVAIPYVSSAGGGVSAASGGAGEYAATAPQMTPAEDGPQAAAAPGSAPSTYQAPAPSAAQPQIATPAAAASPVQGGGQAVAPAYAPPVASSATAGGGAARGGGKPVVSGPVNVNLAGVEQLEALPRIGPAMATRIVEYRNEHGPFQRLEQLGDVRGIGDKTLAQIAPYVTF